MGQVVEMSFKKGSNLRSKGRQLSEEHRAKISKSLKGLRRSLAFRRKISESRKGIKFSDEHKLKLRKVKLGTKHSEATKQKMRRNSAHFWKGKQMSVITRNKMSEAHRGEKCYNWQGGITQHPYSYNFNNELKLKIRLRDNFICKLCGLSESALNGRLSQLDIHHIDYCKVNDELSNLISLCRACHIRTNYERSAWIKFFGATEEVNSNLTAEQILEARNEIEKEFKKW